MKRMSFAMTIPQMLDGSKTVTRRNKWLGLQPGQLLLACDKVMGFKKGERSTPLAVIEVTSVRRERLEEITQQDCIDEGFPNMKPEEFVAMYCKAMKVEPHTLITVIEFRTVLSKKVGTPSQVSFNAGWDARDKWFGPPVPGAKHEAWSRFNKGGA